MSIMNVSGVPITLFQLSRSSLEDVIAIVGEPLEQDTGTIFDMGPYTDSLWALPTHSGRECAFRQMITRIGTAVLMYLPSDLTFNIDVALDVAGLPREYPPGPECTPEGIVTWPTWPDVGEVRIDYPNRGVWIGYKPGGGGGRRRLLDEFTRRRAA